MKIAPSHEKHTCTPLRPKKVSDCHEMYIITPKHANVDPHVCRAPAGRDFFACFDVPGLANPVQFPIPSYMYISRQPQPYRTARSPAATGP